MGFKGSQHIRSKTITDPKVRDQIKEFFFYRRTVHSDICKGHSPTNALLLI